MCGIIGYIGKKQAYPILLEGLQRLEYRGYDSAGIATVEDSQGTTTISLHKDKGRVDVLKQHSSVGTIGIGHTRWATHGVPSTVNAHPHLDCTNSIVVTHNGIIENFREIKENLSIGSGVIGKNDFGSTKYEGPCPPFGKHRYFFKIYALDRPLDLEEGATISEVESAVQKHLLDSGELEGYYVKKLK